MININHYFQYKDINQTKISSKTIKNNVYSKTLENSLKYSDQSINNNKNNNVYLNTEILPTRARHVQERPRQQVFIEHNGHHTVQHGESSRIAVSVQRGREHLQGRVADQQQVHRLSVLFVYVEKYF